MWLYNRDTLALIFDRRSDGDLLEIVDEQRIGVVTHEPFDLIEVRVKARSTDQPQPVCVSADRGVRHLEDGSLLDGPPKRQVTGLDPPEDAAGEAAVLSHPAARSAARPTRDGAGATAASPRRARSRRRCNTLALVGEVARHLQGGDGLADARRATDEASRFLVRNPPPMTRSSAGKPVAIVLRSDPCVSCASASTDDSDRRSIFSINRVSVPLDQTLSVYEQCFSNPGSGWR